MFTRSKILNLRLRSGRDKSNGYRVQISPPPSERSGIFIRHKNRFCKVHKIKKDASQYVRHRAVMVKMNLAQPLLSLSLAASRPSADQTLAVRKTNRWSGRQDVGDATRDPTWPPVTPVTSDRVTDRHRRRSAHTSTDECETATTARTSLLKLSDGVAIRLGCESYVMEYNISLFRSVFRRHQRSSLRRLVIQKPQQISRKQHI